jgi:hypothetical protein
MKHDRNFSHISKQKKKLLKEVTVNYVVITFLIFEKCVALKAGLCKLA